MKDVSLFELGKGIIVRPILHHDSSRFQRDEYDRLASTLWSLMALRFIPLQLLITFKPLEIGPAMVVSESYAYVL